MAKIKWGVDGDKLYEAGLDRAVLYPYDLDAIAWNGLTSFTKKYAGSTTPFYVDSEKYMDSDTNFDFVAEIESVTFPDVFAYCDGSQISKSEIVLPFGLSFRTLKGNDLEGTDLGYKIHLVYNAMAFPHDIAYTTTSNVVSPTKFRWEIRGIPNYIKHVKNTSYLVIDSNETNPATLNAIEDILYGTDEEPARIVSPDELVSLYKLGVSGYGHGPYGHGPYGHGPDRVSE